MSKRRHDERKPGYWPRDSRHPDDVSIKYLLTGSGWAECRIRFGKHQATVTASYLPDALGDFARAVVRLIDGAPSAKFSFAEEPGQYAWTLQHRGDRLRCVVKWYAEYGWDPDRRSKKRFEAEAPFCDFLAAFNLALQGLLAQYGPAGYRERWVAHAFPSAEADRIGEFLSRGVAK